MPAPPSGEVDAAGKVFGAPAAAGRHGADFEAIRQPAGAAHTWRSASQLVEVARAIDPARNPSFGAGFDHPAVHRVVGVELPPDELAEEGVQDGQVIAGDLEPDNWCKVSRLELTELVVARSWHGSAQEGCHPGHSGASQSQGLRPQDGVERAPFGRNR